MLDVIQRCIEASTSEGGTGFRLSRIDGSHNDLERQSTIKGFNGDERIKVCLVSTGAGGTGITLTGADRVIIFDPSWNPADDMQAVDRAYRIGQTRDVIVYRMIAAGTVEEKMYEKQVFKDGLRRTIMGGSGKRKKNVRYFSRAELKQLFTLFPVGECRVLDRLEEMHGTLKDRLEAAESPTQQEVSRDGHLNFVCGLRGSYGASAHGDGLPKIAQQTGGAGAEGGGVNGGGGASQGPSIAEEEDESDVEDSEDDMRNDRGGDGRGRARRNVLQAAGLEEGGLEIDLDEPDGDDSAEDDSGRRRRGAEKGKRKGDRHLRPLRAGAGDDSDSDDEKVLAGAGGDDSMTGADASTAIELDVDSEPEMELDFGDNKGDVVDALEDDDDYGGDGVGWSPMPSGHPTANDTSVEGFGTPGSQPMSPPGSYRSWACDGAETSTSMAGSEIAPISVDPSSPVPSELGHVGEEGDSGVGTLGAPPPAASRTPPASTPLSSPYEEDGAAFASPPEETPAVQAGRERARRWACDALGLSPIASASPSSSRGGGGGGGGDDTEEDEREEDEGGRAGADADGGAGDRSLREGEFLTEGDSDASTATRLHGELETTVKEEEEDEEKEGHQPRRRKRVNEGARRVVGSDVDGQEESEDGGSEEDGGSVASATVARCSNPESPRLDESLSSRWDSPAASFASSDESRTGDLERSVAAPQTPATTAAETSATTGEQRVGSRSSGNLTPPEGGEAEAWPTCRPLSDSACSFTTPGKSDRLASPDRLVQGEAGGSSGESFGPRHSGCSGYETAESAQDIGRGDVSTLERRDDSTPDADASGNSLGAYGSPASHDAQRGEQERRGASAVDNDLEGACEKAKKDEGRCLDISEERGELVESALGPLSPVTSPCPSSPPLPASGSDSATVCAAHKAAAERASYKCLRCSCFAGAQGTEQAQVLLLAAWEQERAGDMHQAVGTCLEAIKLCDEDRELHKTIARVGSKLG
ncbi:unnamed protein product, partial [Laminaria digitata]